jgi:hypothetical protein
LEIRWNGRLARFGRQPAAQLRGGLVARRLEFGHFELKDLAGAVVGRRYAAAAVTRF